MDTRYGCDVADFWAKIRSNVFSGSWQASGATNNTFDVGDWYSYQAARFGYEVGGKKAPFYYQALMALLTCKCVMFEDYDDGQDKAGLERFREEVLYPAVEKVQADLGLSPLIVRLPYNPNFRYTALQWLGNEPAWQRAVEEKVDPVEVLLQTPLNTDNMEPLCDL